MGQDPKPKAPPTGRATTPEPEILPTSPPAAEPVYSNGPFSAGPLRGKVTLHPMPAKDRK